MNPIRNGYWGDDDDSRCQLRLQASPRTLEAGFMLIVAPRPASTCQWRSLSLCNLIIFSLHCEQLHLSEPFCGPGGLGVARDGDAPRMGSHRDGGTKCTGLANLKIKLRMKLGNVSIYFRLPLKLAAPPWFRLWKDSRKRFSWFWSLQELLPAHTPYLYIYIMEEKYALWE